MPENEFRNVNLVLLVNSNWDSFSIVAHLDEPLLSVNGDLELIHLLVPLVVVCGVDQHLVKDLVKARCVCDFLVSKPYLIFW